MSKFGNKGLQRLKARTKGPAKGKGFGVGVTDAAIAASKNKNLKSAASFAAQEGVGQALKKFAGNLASKAFGVAGMILSPTTVYAGGDKSSGSQSITNKELKEQSGLIPEETSEQFQARNTAQSKS